MRNLVAFLFFALTSLIIPNNFSDTNNVYVPLQVNFRTGGDSLMYTYTYDNNANRNSFLLTDFNSNWKTKYIWTWDNNRNLLSHLEQSSYMGGDYKSVRRVTNTYTINNELLTKISEIWDDVLQNWVGNSTYYYYANGNLDSTVSSNEKLIYSYDGNNKKNTFIRQTFENNIWKNNYKYCYSYDNNGNLASELYLVYRNDTTYNYKRNSYIYDANGNVLTIITEYCDLTGIWTNYSRNTYSYLQNQILTSAYDLWKNGEWKKWYSKTYEYNDFNKVKIEYLDEILSWSDTLYAHKKGVYTYDANGNAIRGEYLSLENGVWTPYSGVLNVVKDYPITYSDIYTSYVEVKYGIFTDVKTENMFVDRYSLSQNYPNPFNPSTTISFNVPKSGMVSLKVYDFLGKEIATLVNEFRSAGTYEVEFNATKFSSGIYFYKLQSGSFVETRKMILLK